VTDPLGAGDDPAVEAEGVASGPEEPRWDDVVLAVTLFAVDPAGLGGLALRARPGPVRERVAAWVRRALPDDAPLLRVPAHVTDDRLLGGLSLADTLRAGRVVTERGLLSRADGGAVVVPMAERLEQGVLSHLCAALDRGEVAMERDGVGARLPARLGVVAFDEGIGDDEGAPAALSDRLAFHLDLDALAPRSVPDGAPSPDRVARARTALGQVDVDAAAVEAICRAADVLGIASVRAPLLAATAARAHAALAGRRRATDEDLATAARLVLGPRATRLPVDPEDAPAPQPPEEPPAPPEADAPPEPPPPENLRDDGDPPATPETRDDPSEPPPAQPSLQELVLAAAASGIPRGLLDDLRKGPPGRGGPRSAGRAGASRVAERGGRPAGTVAKVPQRGERLNVVETLRAAAPWQRLRRSAPGDEGRGGRIAVRREDFRVSRHRQPMETSVIFTVDASGSSALQRLAEAKGAVEQVLADCYVRRDHVALIAFRGVEASLLLPPTRSLARVRRSLAGMAGGGATPLAAGIDAARDLALDARRRGRTPLVVVMTDGRANVARDGRQGAGPATEDALASARALREDGVPVLFLDTAPRPRPRARELAEAMAARYLPLPYLDAAGVSREVQSMARSAG